MLAADRFVFAQNNMPVMIRPVRFSKTYDLFSVRFLFAYQSMLLTAPYVAWVYVSRWTVTYPLLLGMSLLSGNKRIVDVTVKEISATMRTDGNITGTIG
jgi:hypothetical protein